MLMCGRQSVDMPICLAIILPNRPSSNSKKICKIRLKALSNLIVFQFARFLQKWKIELVRFKTLNFKEFVLLHIV